MLGAMPPVAAHRFRAATRAAHLKLEGDVKDAAFELTEKGERGNIVARLDGALLGKGAALARWTTHDVSEPVTLDSAGVSLYPNTLTLPGGAKIAPSEDYDNADGCVTDSVFPHVSNVPAEAVLNRKLNMQLRLTPSDGSSCVPMGFWDMASYVVTAHSDDWVSFEMRSYGCAHPRGRRQSVLDRKPGRRKACEPRRRTPSELAQEA